MLDQRAAIRVEDRWLLVHLARPAALRCTQLLLLYVTGDGGWRGKDAETYAHLRAFGQPVAGFSAPDFLAHLRGGADSLSPSALRADFDAITDAAAERLNLPTSLPVVLVGVSRGADLVVVAAEGDRHRRSLAGVILVALTEEEEYVLRPPHRHFGGRRGTDGDEPAGEMIRPYELLDRIDAPLALIQSTSDEYVPAARAAALFGPEGPHRRFFAIDARNHSFSHARTAMYAALRTSLEWVAGGLPLPRGGGRP